ncbi:MAG: hypothetical protein WCV72_00895 [Patescibacteria group bacterium]
MYLESKTVLAETKAPDKFTRESSSYYDRQKVLHYPYLRHGTNRADNLALTSARDIVGELNQYSPGGMLWDSERDESGRLVRGVFDQEVFTCAYPAEKQCPRLEGQFCTSMVQLIQGSRHEITQAVEFCPKIENTDQLKEYLGQAEKGSVQYGCVKVNRSISE